MKKNLSTILAAVSCLLVVICLFQISNLNHRISSLESNVVNQIGQVRNEVNGISSTISSSLEEQASLLTDSSWEYGEADYDTRTVELICSVSPKEYSSETAAAILVGDTEYPMTLSNGAFTARASIPLVEETRVEKVLFREGDTTRTELLDWYLSPRYDYLLNVYADLSGNATGSPKDGVYHYHREGDVNVNVDGTKKTNSVKSVTLVEVMDGNELSRTNIALDNTNSNSTHGPVGTISASPDYSTSTEFYGAFHYFLEQDYEIPYGSTWTLYVELVDGNSLVYRSIVDRQEINTNGEPSDETYWWLGVEASIYDIDGNVLYEPDESLYK